MVFHPVMQEVTRALRARRDPPPPAVPTLPDDVLRRFGQKILRHPSRREIAEGILIIAIRLDVMGFTAARDQLLLLVGCGLTASEITDALEQRRADLSGAHALMKKARSTSATPMERMLRESSDSTASGVGLRARQRRQELGRNRSPQQERLKRSRKERMSRASTPLEEVDTKGLGPDPARPGTRNGRRGDDDST